MPKNYTVKQAVSQTLLEIGMTQFEISQAVDSPDQDIAQAVALLSAVAAELLLDGPYQESLGDGNWLLTTGNVPTDRPETDEDIILFDGRLAVAGIKWRLRQAKGLEFGEDLRDFSSRLNKLSARANARVLDLDSDWSRVQ